MTIPSHQKFRWLWAALAASPALFPLFLILHYGVDFHFMDEWNTDIGGLYIKLAQHQLTFADLIAQHNEHRIFIPRLIYLLINPITHWNTIVDLITGWLIVCATSLLLLRLLSVTLPGDRFWLPWFICNVLIFTAAQWENWLWGMGLANFTPTFFIFAAILIAYGRSRFWLRLVMCVLLAVTATYCSGNGILAWPLAGVLLIWPDSPDQWAAKKKILTIWVVAFALIVAIYFVGYQKPTHGGVGYYTLNPAAIFTYNLAFMGCPFADCTAWGEDVNSITIGSILLLLYLAAIAHFLYLWKWGSKDASRRMLPWLMVGGFGILSGLMSSFFRAGAGTQQALESRYVTYALYLPVSLAILLPMSGADLKSRWSKNFPEMWAHLPAMGATMVLIMVIFSIPHALNESWNRSIHFRQGRGAIMLLNIVPDNPMLACAGNPRPEGLSQIANALNGMGYVHPPLLTSPNAAQISRENSNSSQDVLGTMQGVQSTANGGRLVYGWAVFPKAGYSAECVFLTYDNADHQPIIFTAAIVGAPRSEIADSLGNPDYANCGWQAPLLPQQIDPAIKQTQISAWVLDVDTGRATKLDGSLAFQR